MDPEFVTSVKEILRIDTQLRELRSHSRHLEVEREHHREILFEHIGPKAGGSSTCIQTPYGDIVIDERDRGARFSIEDIRDILESSTIITRDQIEKLMIRFAEEEDSLKTRVRTLSVRKPHTRRKHHTSSTISSGPGSSSNHRRKHKTERHSIRAETDLNPPVSLNSTENSLPPDRTTTFNEDPVADASTGSRTNIGAGTLTTGSVVTQSWKI